MSGSVSHAVESPLTVGGASAVFGANGRLATVLDGFEVRSGQGDFAQAVADALDARTQLLIEAGTGTGKTLAYLHAAIQSGLRVVVSTASKALQDQLCHTDLPTLEQVYDAPIAHQLLKGRTNYLCWSRAAPWLQQTTLDLDDTSRALSQLRAWSDATTSGDLAELANTNVALETSELTASAEQCLGRRCADYERCFVTQARRAAQTVPLVVVNHHLYFADLALRARGLTQATLLPPHDAVIFDEAHELPDIVPQYFGVTVGHTPIRDFITDLMRRIVPGSDLAHAVRGPITALELAGLRLSSELAGLPTQTRLGEEALAANVRLASAREAISNALVDLEERLMAGGFDDALTMVSWAGNIRDALCSATGAIDEVQDPVWRQWIQDDPNAWVRYVRGGPQPTLHLRPVVVGPLLAPHFENRTLVLSSATLSLDGDFGLIKRELNLPDAQTRVVASPFDYREQMRLFLPNEAPKPGDAGHGEWLESTVERLVAASGGGALVLCTSHRMRARLAERLREHHLVLSEASSAKHRLLHAFRVAGNAVLVGSMSYWQGIDVPGHALRLVIIDRLPFDVPSDPMVEQRTQWCASHNQSAFWTHQLPRAALRLRQGVGRLIRKETDQGLVAILDGRLTQGRYAKKLQKSLPECPTLTTLEDAEHYLQAIHKKGNGLNA